MQDVEVEVEILDPNSALDNEDYIYGIDLFNNGFHWESHVWWEALWNKAGRKGAIADFLKGLIKIAAAGVKYRLGHQEATQGHINRAIELIKLVESEVGEDFCSLNLIQIIENLKELKLEDGFSFTLNLTD